MGFNSGFKGLIYAFLFVFNHVVYLGFLDMFLTCSELISIEQPKVFPS